ncbi:MAG: SDR family oxidoreductase, partial [bacterium]
SDIDKYRNLFSLQNKIIIITGGAGHLGSPMSKALASFGATVILIGRNEQKLRDFVKQNQTEGNNRFEYFVCDVTREEDFQEVVKKVVSNHGKIDVLINNAHSGKREKFEDLTKAAFCDGLEHTLTHYFTCIKTVSPIMLKAGSGSIINTASLFSYLAPDQRMYLDLGNCPPIHYAVAKGGILQMTRYLATLWADKGIRVNGISPGWFPQKRGPERPDYMHEITRRIPMGRIGQPDDLAGIVVYLASDASSYVTGQNFIVDGGYSIW